MSTTPERSGPFLIKIDRESAPGKAICHFVRFETIILDVDDKLLNIDFVQIDENVDNRAFLLRQAYGELFRERPELLPRRKKSG